MQQKQALVMGTRIDEIAHVPPRRGIARMAGRMGAPASCAAPGTRQTAAACRGRSSKGRPRVPERPRATGAWLHHQESHPIAVKAIQIGHRHWPAASLVVLSRSRAIVDKRWADLMA
jgi:hypothetical protein